MTAKELYDTSPEFRAFLRIWEDERQCPVPLVDFLLEQGLEGPAECCRWASGETTRIRTGIGGCSIHPSEDYREGWYWVIWPIRGCCKYSNELFRDDLMPPPSGLISPEFGDVANALLWLLDQWKIPVPVGT